ncbi:hypothetical protein PV327_001224 [Microctonus hyperodae]|uniref:Integrator complex subunit 12 n=1 Tax=Microctonus hyperodae TaxID=165561 RepID=A0AA39G8A3_MICHY|nr:hypothetical protein PV327_001224 [Microctonus hyperodae]
MLSCDSDTDIEDEFFTALALFKSTTRSSELKLREMLLTSIARRKKFFNHDKKIPVIYFKLKSVKSTIEKHIDNFENNENLMETNEIPTISIPDEEFNDFTTCKICDGAKIGPFILLECQDCLDTYHPLCHQPPVIDIDVYDPRLVWRCSKCTGFSPGIFPTLTSQHSSEENLSENNYKQRDEDTQIIDKENLRELKSSRRNKTFSSLGIVDERGIKTKDTIKEEYSSLGIQLRKRIGSKLTVSRVNSKL